MLQNASTTDFSPKQEIVAKHERAMESYFPLDGDRSSPAPAPLEQIRTSRPLFRPHRVPERIETYLKSIGISACVLGLNFLSADRVRFIARIGKTSPLFAKRADKGRHVKSGAQRRARSKTNRTGRSYLEPYRTWSMAMRSSRAHAPAHTDRLCLNPHGPNGNKQCFHLYEAE